MIAAWLKYVNVGFKTAHLSQGERESIAELLRMREAANARLGPLVRAKEVEA